jgi:lambda family phage tail tape measure protein
MNSASALAITVAFTLLPVNSGHAQTPPKPQSGSVESLPDVDVKATKTPAKGSEAEAVQTPPVVEKFQLPQTSSSTTAAKIQEQVNIVDAQDAVKYLPSLFVRKRNNGDTQPVLATRTWGVNSSARSLVYADDLLLTALVANNNTIGAPRWGLVSPEEIKRIDVLYGPFAAAYPGNSMGAVMQITTQMPDKPVATIKQTEVFQSFMHHRVAPPINDGKGTGSSDPFERDIQALGRENAGLQFAIDNWEKYAGKVRESKIAIAEFDLAFGKFSDAQRALEGFSPLSDKQKSQYRELMQNIENEKRQVDQLNKVKSFGSKTTELEQNRAAEIEKRQQELELIGKSTAEAARLKTIFDEQEKAQQRINQSLREGVFLSEAQKQAALDSARAYADRLNAIADQKRALERDPSTGFKNFFNNLAETSGNTAQQVQNALSGAFTSATDALVKFCETGKINFRSLASSIIDGLLKIAAQAALGGIVSAIGGAFGLGAGSAGGGFSKLLSGLFSGGRASGGGVNAGGLYLVGESGPELLAMGGNGTVVPNHQLREAVTSGSVSSGGAIYNGDVNVTVNHNGSTDVSGGAPNSALQNMGAVIGNKVREILIYEQRPGGLLAGA